MYSAPAATKPSIDECIWTDVEREMVLWGYLSHIRPRNLPFYEQMS